MAATLAELLAQRAEGQPDKQALAFLADNGDEQSALSYGQLQTRARALAGHLAQQARPGDRAILMLPTGPDFVVALFACAMTGIIAVPVMLPRRLASRDASETILADCSPRLMLTDRATATSARAERLQRDGMAWICVDDPLKDSGATFAAPAPDDLALLQYTSGSTSQPKGVMVSHRNLLANLQGIRAAFGNSDASTYVNWGPLYHDMGLVMDLLQPIYLGSLGVLMRPAAFVQRPLTWLRAIHAYRAEVAGAPNFAFDLCVQRLRPELMEGIDLSCWKLAFNGAEPVRAATLARFAAAFAPYGFDAQALYPCYGLAEATLMVAGGRRGAGADIHRLSRAALIQGEAAAPRDDADARAMVACGRAVVDTAIAIVDPQNGRQLAPDKIGEIWASGPGVAQGYWNDPAATEASFHATLPGTDQSFLRTGDLGFLDSAGTLVITGRAKDVLIIRGMNHYPQDIEDTVARAHPALSADGAVFMAGEESERVIVAQEVGRAFRRDLPAGEIADAVREAVAREHEVSVQTIVLLKPGTLPKTTSGKVQRRRTALLWREDKLERADQP